jgi:hypothetical protein
MCVTRILGDEVTGEEVKVHLAAVTALQLHPEEILDGSRPPAFDAGGRIEQANLFPDVCHHHFGFTAKCLPINRAKFLADDPERHGIYVEAGGIATGSDRLE